MFLNLYCYSPRAGTPADIYQAFLGLFPLAACKPRCHDVVETLPPGQADHPGDLRSRRLRKAELEQGLASGEIVSFNLSNKASLADPDIVVCYLNDRRHGGVGHLSVHAPLPDDAAAAPWLAAFDQLAAACRPEYGFVARTPSAATGVKYVLASTLYRQELNNFSDYLRRHPHIGKMRMVYPVNYLSAAQLGVDGLRAAIAPLAGADALVPLADDLWRWPVPEPALSACNQALGAQGRLVSAEVRRRE